jgi:hypothetical protein
MNPRHILFTLALAGSIALLRPAWADVPPPEGYVETCTVADQQTATSECLLCYATRGMADRCEPLLAPYCFTKVCHAWNGSNEVWCRTAGSGVPTVPAATLDALCPTGYPLPPAIDGGATAPSSCLPFVPAAAGGQGGSSTASGPGTAGASGPSSSGAGKSSDGSGCAVGGWVSVKALGPWILAGLFAALVALRPRRRR